MYFIKTPSWVPKLFPNYIWRVSTTEMIIYLTFDDGPVPEVTPWVLDILKDYDAQATFFCVGANVERYPTIFERILQEGHRIGNHTFHHLNGWKTPAITYLENVQQCADVVTSTLFRPPYGRLGRAQTKALRKDYQIILWDVLSADFDARISPQKCAANVLRYTQAGSIVVFHDSLKAKANMQYALSATLAYFSKQGFSFCSLPSCF